MVEAGGVEPPSEDIPLRPLHTYPDFSYSPLLHPSGKVAQELSWIHIRLPEIQASQVSYPAHRRPSPSSQERPAGR